jgi:hypothetical protein
MEQSRDAFDVVRGLLKEATNETLDVSTIVGDTGFSAIITDEQERLEFVARLGDKYWLLTEEVKLGGSFTFAGTAAAGEGDITLSLGGEKITFTPTAADTPDLVAAAAAAINGSSLNWTGSSSGAVTRVLPLVEGLNGQTFVAQSEDTGITVTAKSPFELPADIQLGGTATLNGRTAIFPGSAFRTPTP